LQAGEGPALSELELWETKELGGGEVEEEEEGWGGVMDLYGAVSGCGRGGEE
jgi:hypothetical protein